MFTPNVATQKRKWYFGPLTILAYATIAVTAFVGSVFADADLPAVHQDILLAMAAEATPPPEPPAPPPADVPKPAQPDAPNPNAAPPEAPEGIKPEPPRLPDVPTGTPPNKICVNCVPGGDPNVKPILGDPPPPLPPPPSPEPQKPVPVGGNIKEPEKIKHVVPIYPPIALSARVQGIVIIEATIDVNGNVINAKILRPVALLDQAALDAVRQWKYRPTLLNGKPVPVIMTVTVNFSHKEPN
jgi:protein TonB